MRRLGHEDWSIEHAFYADSGGFILHATDYAPFPISAKQLEYLIQNNYIPKPILTREEIWDKSNADRAAKFLTSFQSMWLVVQAIGRAIQHLPITPLELSTISVIGCSLTTLGFWLRKPLDVQTPTTLTMNRAIADIAANTKHTENEPFLNSPLDFIEPEAYMSSKWNRTVYGWIQSQGLQKRPMQRIPDDRDLQPSSLKQHIMLGIATAAFASIHLFGWNFHFSTSWESTLWRANTLIMSSLLCVYGTFEVLICWKEGYRKLGLDTCRAYKRRWPWCLFFFVPAFLYLCTRLIIIFESLWSLRALPKGAFATVSWSEYFPHI